MPEICNAMSAVSHIGGQITALNAQVLVVQRSVGEVSQDVHKVGHLANSTANRLEQLWELFVEFIDQDKRAKALQLAETRLIKIRQEIEKKFGIRDLVRRRMLGLLQADDINLVRQNTSLFVAEQTLMDAPNYWLAPALIGFAGWIANNEQLTKDAFLEMLKRDAVKGKLFLVLLFQRSGRDAESGQLVNQYLATQSPEVLNREAITLIDAASNGLLPPAVSSSILNQLTIWLETLKLDPNFDNRQIETWFEILKQNRLPFDEAPFGNLKSVATNWKECTEPQSWSGLHLILSRKFVELFNIKVTVDADVKSRIDSLLEHLVEDYESDEVELRIDEMLNSAIVDLEGDRETAMAKISLFRKEKSEQLSIGELLAVATSDNTQNRASVATRKLATLLSRVWIINVIEIIRSSIDKIKPKNISINIDGFFADVGQQTSSETVYGGQAAYYDHHESLAIKAARWRAANIGMLIAGCVSLFIGGYGLVIGFGLIVFAIYSIVTSGNKIKAEFAERRQRYHANLTDVLAEISAYWKHIESADKIAVTTIAYLQQLNEGALGKTSDSNLIRRLDYGHQLPTWTP